MPQEPQDRGILWDSGCAAAVPAQTGGGRCLRALGKENPLGSWLCSSIRLWEWEMSQDSGEGESLRILVMQQHQLQALGVGTAVSLSGELRVLSVRGLSCQQEHGPPPGSSVSYSQLLYRAHKPLSISIKKSSSSLAKGKICRVKIKT